MENLFTSYKMPESKERVFTYLAPFKAKDADYSLVNKYKNEEKSYKKIKNKLSLRVVLPSVLLLIIWLICFALCIDHIESLNYKRPAPYYILIFVASAAVIAAIIIAAVKISKRLEIKYSMENKKEALVSLKKSLISLTVPELTYYKTDVFTSQSRIKKNGKIGFLKPTVNKEYIIFGDKDFISFFDLEAIYTIPLSNVASFLIHKKPISFTGWNKEEAYTSQKYKPYKIGYNTESYQYFVKNCSHLTLDIDGQEYEIIFPPYETPIIEEITGIKAELPPERKEK